MPFDGLDCERSHGVELWSFVNDTGEAVTPERARAAALRARAGARLDHPPERNLRAWDELCRERRVVALGGSTLTSSAGAVGPVVPLRVMAYRRSFRFIRTHVLCGEPPTGELEHDREQVYGALRGALLHRRRRGGPGARLHLRGGRPAHGREALGRRTLARPHAAGRPPAAASTAP